MSDGILRVYDKEKAIGQELLVTANNGKFRDQFYVNHLILPTEDILLISENNIFLLKKLLDITGGGWEAEWNISRQDIVRFTFGKTTITITKQNTGKQKAKHETTSYSFVVAKTEEETATKASQLFGLLKLPKSVLDKEKQSLVTERGHISGFGERAHESDAEDEEHVIEQRKEKQKETKKGHKTDEKEKLLPKEDETCCKCSTCRR